MNNTEEIAKVVNSKQDIQWIQYPPHSCFDCRVALIAESDGGFSVYAINLPGVVSQGETEQEALANIVDALSGALAEYKVFGEIPWEEAFIEDDIMERRVLVDLNEIPMAG